MRSNLEIDSTETGSEYAAPWKDVEMKKKTKVEEVLTSDSLSVLCQETYLDHGYLSFMPKRTRIVLRWSSGE